MWGRYRVCLGLCAQLAPVCLTGCSFPPAMQQVLDNLGSLPNATGAAELDLIFLRGIMESPIVRSLAKVQCCEGFRHKGTVPGEAWGQGALGLGHVAPETPREGMHGHPRPDDESEPLQGGRLPPRLTDECVDGPVWMRVVTASL